MKNVLLLFTFLIYFSSFSQKGQPRGGTGDFGWSTIKEDRAEWVFYLRSQDIRFTNKADAVEFVNDYRESVRKIKTIVKPLYTIVSTKVTIKILDENGDLLEDVGWQYSNDPQDYPHYPPFESDMTEEELKERERRSYEYEYSKNPSKSLKKFVARRISFWNEITKCITI